MIVSITGGTGFIGRRLVAHHLAAGDMVRVLSRGPGTSLPPGVSHFQGDLASSSYQLKGFLENASVLYHCAGEIRDRERMESVHVEGTRRLLQAFPSLGRWVQLSSVGAYGDRRTGIVTEDDAPNPLGDYEITKTRADELVMEAGRSGLDYTILRPSNVFGAGMPNQSLVQLCKMIQRGKFFFIGPLGASSNYVHVDNVVHALVLCGTLPQASGRIYVVSDWRSQEAFVESICHLVGCPVPILRVPESVARLVALFGKAIPGFPLTQSRVSALTTSVRYGSGRLERELGYTPSVSVEAGLAELLRSAGLCNLSAGI